MSRSRDPLRLGLIGAGRWGQNYVRTIADLAGVELARLGIRDLENVRLVGSGCEVSSNWREVIGAGDLDGVIIATPAPAHAEMTLAAIEADLPVLVEKPMTLTLADADAVVDAAREKGAIVRVNHVHLYSAAWRALKREAAALGPVRAIAARAGGPGPVRPETPMIWDYAPHDVAMCLDLLESAPRSVTASARTTVETGTDLEGTAVEAVLDFAGVTATLRLCNADAVKTRRFAVTCEKGALVYDDQKADKLCRGHDADSATAPVALDAGLPLTRAVASFADAIAAARPDAADARLGRDAIAVIERLDAAIA